MEYCNTEFFWDNRPSQERRILSIQAGNIKEYIHLSNLRLPFKKEGGKSCPKMLFHVSSATKDKYSGNYILTSCAEGTAHHVPLISGGPARWQSPPVSHPIKSVSPEIPPNWQKQHILSWVTNSLSATCLNCPYLPPLHLTQQLFGQLP